MREVRIRMATHAEGAAMLLPQKGVNCGMPHSSGAVCRWFSIWSCVTVSVCQMCGGVFLVGR